MKTLWLGLTFVLLLGRMPAQSNEGCDVLKIAGARLVAVTLEGAVTARLNRTLGLEGQKQMAKSAKSSAAVFDEYKPLARDVTSNELARLQPDLRQVFIIETGTFSVEGEPLFTVYYAGRNVISVETGEVSATGKRLYNLYEIDPKQVASGCTILASEKTPSGESYAIERKQAEALSWKAVDGDTNMDDGTSMSCGDDKVCITLAATPGIQAHFLMEKLRSDMIGLSNDSDAFAVMALAAARTSWSDMLGIYCRRYPGAKYTDLERSEKQCAVDFERLPLDYFEKHPTLPNPPPTPEQIDDLMNRLKPQR